MNDRPGNADGTEPPAKESVAAPLPTAGYIELLECAVSLDRSALLNERVSWYEALAETDAQSANVDGKIYAEFLRNKGFQPIVDLRIGAGGTKAQAAILREVGSYGSRRTRCLSPDDLKIGHSAFVTMTDSWVIAFEEPDGHCGRFFAPEERAEAHDVPTDKSPRPAAIPIKSHARELQGELR